MVNASTLAAVAGAAAGAAAGADLGTAPARRAVAHGAAPPASPQRTSASALLDFLARKGILGPAGGAVMKARARTAAVPGYAAASRSERATATASGATRAATSATSRPSTSTSSPSFLSDPKLSIEEKLMRLMAYLNDKYEKDMQAKMDEMAGKAPAATSSTKKKSGGILGKIAGAVSSVVGGGALSAVSGFLKFPGVKTVLGHVAGPVLAAGASALGFPAAAPVLLTYGSKAVDAVAGVASAATSSSATSGTSGTSSTSGADGKNDQLAMMEIQRLMDKQKEMFSLVSNILKAGHDTRMAAINNVR